MRNDYVVIFRYVFGHEFKRNWRMNVP